MQKPRAVAHVLYIKGATGFNIVSSLSKQTSTYFFFSLFSRMYYGTNNTHLRPSVLARSSLLFSSVSVPQNLTCRNNGSQSTRSQLLTRRRGTLGDRRRRNCSAGTTSFYVEILGGVRRLHEPLIEPMKGTPNTLCNVPRRAVRSKHVAGKPLQQRMLRDEAEILVISRMISTKGDILQVEEVVVGWHMIWRWASSVHHSETLVCDFQDARLRPMDSHFC